MSTDVDIAGHSAEQFVTSRDFWWHADFLAAAVQRWNLVRGPEVLDVGCGVGHWGRLVARLIPLARITGVDPESRWVQRASQTARELGLSEGLQYRVGNALELQFDGGSFDLVTCQTVLMHLKDPALALSEMVRVTRPGGMVVAAEPTNICGPIVDSIALGDHPRTTAKLLELLMTCQLGCSRLGEGNALVGESLPLLFQNAGLVDIDVRQCDRTWTMVPPYRSDFERAQVEDARDALAKRWWVWDQSTAKRNFLAGDGTEQLFDEYWELAMNQLERVVAAIDAGTFSRSSGGLSYLVSGRRPMTGGS